jgi:hypothetical protein
MSREHGHKFPDKFSESDSQVCVGHGLDCEVAATDNESGLLPEGSTRVNVPPTRLRKHATKLGHGAAAQERIDSSEEPYRKDQPAISQVASDLTRCAEDAGADRISDPNSKAKACAEYAQQVTAACAELKEAAWWTLGIRGGRLWQDLVSGGHWA